MTWRTIEQILRVIEKAAQRFSRGDEIDSSYHAAVSMVAREYGVAYQTIGDACRRRLALDGVDEFKRMLRDALEGNPKELRNLIVSKAPAYEQKIDLFFQNLSGGKGILKPIQSEQLISYTIKLRKVDSDILRALSQLLGNQPEEILAEVTMEAIKDRMKKAVSQI